MLDLAMTVLKFISCPKHNIWPVFHKLRREFSRNLNHDFFVLCKTEALNYLYILLFQILLPLQHIWVSSAFLIALWERYNLYVLACIYMYSQYYSSSNIKIKFTSAEGLRKQETFKVASWILHLFPIFPLKFLITTKCQTDYSSICCLANIRYVQVLWEKEYKTSHIGSECWYRPPP